MPFPREGSRPACSATPTDARQQARRPIRANGRSLRQDERRVVRRIGAGVGSRPTGRPGDDPSQ